MTSPNPGAGDAKTPYTLGLDIGMASVGAALLAHDRILALHVRTFDKAETPDGEPLNLVRRLSRGTRRRIRRRAYRLLKLARLFKRQGLIPEACPESFARHGPKAWDLRAAGLDRALEPLEWAAVLYHLCKHRGFQSTRKTEGQGDKDATAVLDSIRQNAQQLLDAGYRTPGEMAVRDASFSHARRNKSGTYVRTFRRTDIQDEVAKLFAAQRSLGNLFADKDIEADVSRWLMARRPALSGEALKKMVGRCTFEPGEARAARATHTAERFIWLSALNNLRILNRGKSRDLTESERAVLIELPFQQAKLTFLQARKLLELGGDDRFNKVNYRLGDAAPESKTLFEAKAFHEVRKAYEHSGLQALWERDRADRDRLDALGEELTYGKQDDEIREKLAQRGVEPEIIEAVLQVSFEKFIQLSLKALSKIMPHLVEGSRYDEAVARAGYHHSQIDGQAPRQKSLPAPDREKIRNPVVYRALNQARKLVNAIIQTYGPPSAVHIELARDLSRPFDERRKIERDQNSFQKAKEKAVQEFEGAFRVAPRKDNLQKFLLYREQNGQCAYSQRSIDVGRLIEDGYVEVDHILPYSRSYDDSKNNRVLVLTAENRNKGNRTPYEYLGGDQETDRWQVFAAWVKANKSIRPAKRDRLLRVHFGKGEADEFKERNLNDTRFICREFKRMIETHLQWHPDASETQHCVVVAGQLTSLLRTRWGLIKVREDGDLHHALDAAVIAACSRGLVKRMADYSRSKELRQLGERFVDPETGEVLEPRHIKLPAEHFPAPWPHFREELVARLSPEPFDQLVGLAGYDDAAARQAKSVRVSRAPTRRKMGKAHQETIRSKGQGGKWLVEGKSAVNTPIRDLRLKDLPNIVGYDDPRNAALINAIRSRLVLFEDDGQKAFGEGQDPLRKPSGPGKMAPVIRTVKVLSVQKSGLDVRGGIAKNGDMLRYVLADRRSSLPADFRSSWIPGGSLWPPESVGRNCVTRSPRGRLWSRQLSAGFRPGKAA